MKELHFRGTWLSLAFGLAVWACGAWLWPQLMNYQEEYQLFVWTADYLVQRLMVVGGLADYVSEFLVQFCYVPWLGALLWAGLLVGLQRGVLSLCARHDGLAVLLSFVPSLLLLVAMGDPDVLWSLPVALILACVCAHLPHFIRILLFPLTYWLLGPVAWITLLYGQTNTSGSPSGARSAVCRWVVGILWALLCMVVFSRTLLRQYPPLSVWRGINYYRIPTMWPALPMVGVLACLVVPWASRHLAARRRLTVLVAACLSVATAVGGAFTYQRDRLELMAYDYLVRQAKWDELVQRAERRQPRADYGAVCVNLALAMRGELPDRLDAFYQDGQKGLVAPFGNDCVSLLPSAEVFWRLGMVNEALRYFFDTQEAILNCRKSGRCTARMVECYLVNGWPEAAAGHIETLRRTLFYRRFALNAEWCLRDDKRVDAHPVWGRQRQLRYRTDGLFSYDELYKMFGRLYLDNQQNDMALQYYVANCRLLGIDP